MTEYVLGFAYCKDYAECYRVLLIRKNKPAWQAGHLNGIGGKVELGDPNPQWALSREFKEGCGLEQRPEQWLNFAILEFPGVAKIYCFASWWEWKLFKTAHTMTDEEICSIGLDGIMDEPKALANLPWLIPMGLKAWCTPGPKILKIVEVEGCGFAT